MSRAPISCGACGTIIGEKKKLEWSVAHSAFYLYTNDGCSATAAAAEFMVYNVVTRIGLEEISRCCLVVCKALGVAGAVFGAGWWFWVDAVVCSAVKVSFLHYLPGIFASLAALMFNCVRKEDIDYSPYDEGEWRLKLWLFVAYVVSFVSLAASVGLLIQDALVESGPSAWTGVAGVLQCVFVLISGLIYWTSHSE
ncbi:hypothetical protein DM860_013431 [Cuscuta australis]|uniref:Transmembrane protein 50A n=1 Tax=Cuscuta australis TaxID=267555 RepID=A0A328D1A7_9ASTE|nr:hypothetical protein DM860_013431 [Cuscuta australis]